MSKNVTVKELIEALSKLSNQDAEVTINIQQSNKVYGVAQLKIKKGYADGEYDSASAWVTNSYGGSITVYLPDGAYISKMPKAY